MQRHRNAKSIDFPLASVAYRNSSARLESAAAARRGAASAVAGRGGISGQVEFERALRTPGKYLVLGCDAIETDD